MTTDFECPTVHDSASAGCGTGEHAAGHGPAENSASALCAAIALIETRMAKAIREAAEQRRRAAIMIIGFAPRCGCNGAAPCWDIGLSRLMAACGKQAGEWGPLRLNETTLVLIAQGFEDSACIQRRASAILRSLDADWCGAGHGARLDCAIGIGLFPEDGDSAPILLRRAEEALHDLRAVGQNAAGFNLRRTLPAERPAQSRSTPRAWHRAAASAVRRPGSRAAYEQKGAERPIP